MAVTGASGMIYARTLLGALQEIGSVETHLIVSSGARRVLETESGWMVDDMETLAHEVHQEDDLTAPPSSGSWLHNGMVICPCSMASLSAIAQGFAHNLIHRAADVAIKERRPLVLVVRETPLSHIHLKNMLSASEAGAVITPASPGFYHGPETIQDLADHLIGRVLDQLSISHDLIERWGDQQE